MQRNAFKQVDMVKLKTSIRMRKKEDFSDLERGGWCQTGWFESQTADLLV